jgi:hypothetical protein
MKKQVKKLQGILVKLRRIGKRNEEALKRIDRTIEEQDKKYQKELADYQLLYGKSK